MAKKINPIRKFLSNGAGKSILYPVGFRRKSFGAWFVILALIGLVIGIGLNFSFDFKSSEVKADTAGTSATVSNVAPDWSVDAEESAEYSTANPRNAGLNVSFVATAADLNGDPYYLAVCKTTGITPNNGAAPTCDGGAGDTWDVSDAANSGNIATATYTTSESDDPSNAWFAYICDGHATAAACDATPKQGSSTTISPFVVNHGASFTVLTDAADPVNPGATVTITTTASDAEGTEPDDTLDIFVCKTVGATSAGCDGGDSDTWCKDDTTNPTTDPTCSWTMDINETGVVTANQCEGAYSYWAYIYDNHGFAATATGGKQETEFTNTVSNVAPDVSATSLNSGSNFQLSTEETSDNITVTGTVTDNNGCEDINDATTADTSIYYYKNGVAGYTNCDIVGESNDNYCYAVKDCAYVADSCTGTTDLSSTFTCTVAIKYHANPTDGANATDSTWYDYTWRDTLIASDGTASDTLESSDIEMLGFMAYDVVETGIAYGNPLSPGDTSADKTTEVKALGNVGLDNNLYSTVANMCSDYPTYSGSTMAIAQQHWDSVDDPWASMSTLTTNTADELELNCAKSTSATPASASVHWKLKIPDPQAAASYTGQNTIAGKQGEAQSW